MQRHYLIIALQGPDGLLLELPDFLVRYAVIGDEWVSMTVNNLSHPSMLLHQGILILTLVRIYGLHEWLNFL